MTIGTLVLIAPLLSACPSKPRASGPLTVSVAGPISISVTAPSQVRAGDLVKLTVKMRSMHGSPQWVGHSWGDGVRGVLVTMEGPCFNGFSPHPKPIAYPTPSLLPPGKATLLFSHRYRRPGTYTFSINADEYIVCNKKSPTATARFVVHVSGPTAPGNGPDDPDPWVGIYNYKGGVVTGDVGAVDHDGYIRSVTATWPDGTTHTYVNTEPCKEQVGGYPDDQVQFHWARRMKPGLYRMKAVVVSTDCTGGTPQTLTDIRPFRVLKAGWANTTPNIYLPHCPTVSTENDQQPVNPSVRVQVSPSC